MTLVRKIKCSYILGFCHAVSPVYSSLKPVLVVAEMLIKMSDLLYRLLHGVSLSLLKLIKTFICKWLTRVILFLMCNRVSDCVSSGTLNR